MWSLNNYDMTNTDLNFYESGELKCVSGETCPPAVKDRYVIHYIISGKGTFKYNNKIYNLKAGNAFLICPEYLSTYQADLEDPWHYIWVGFNGVKVPKIIHQAGLSNDNPIFFYDTDDFFIDTIREIASHSKYSLGFELYRIAYLNILLAKLVEIAPANASSKIYQSNQEEYVKSAVEYIEKNYIRELSVNEIANYIGINRKYLSKIFKKSIGQAPSDYIIKTRIESACYLLKNSYLSIMEVSNSLGYGDRFVFTKQFKKIMGQTPSSYRKSIELGACTKM